MFFMTAQLQCQLLNTILPQSNTFTGTKTIHAVRLPARQHPKSCCGSCSACQPALKPASAQSAAASASSASSTTVFGMGPQLEPSVV